MSPQIIALIIDPIMIVGLLCYFLKIVRKNYIYAFIVVSILHLIIFSFNPLKDDFWFTMLVTRVFANAVVMLGIGYAVSVYSNNEDDKKNVE